MSTLIAGVGYHNLRDISLGPLLVPVLSQLDWPPEVEVEDLSFGPIAVVQRFETEPDRYQRLVFVAAVERQRPPGTLTCYRWERSLPDPDEIQARIAEAVTGIISLDNLLIIMQHFGVLPDEVLVVEVEPEDTGWGAGFSAPVEAALDQVIQLVRRAALEGYHEQPA